MEWVGWQDKQFEPYGKERYRSMDIMEIGIKIKNES